MENIEINYLNDNLDEVCNSLDDIDKINQFKIDVNSGLEEALIELDSLKKNLDDGTAGTLLEACKDSVISSITSQFGIASMIIENKDGGNVTTTQNFEKGIVSTESDKQQYQTFKTNNDGSREWKEIRKETGYDKPLPKMRKEAFKKNNPIINEYNGEILPKDGRAHIDHIVSAKEIESKACNHLHLSIEERAKLATSDENLAWTDSRTNQSKNADRMEDWLDKEDKKTGMTKADRFSVDKEMALEKDANARKHIKKEQSKAAFKKYSKEVVSTGLKDAGKMAAYSAIGVIMKDFTQAIFDEFKITFQNKGKESFSEILSRFKDRMLTVLVQIKEKWKDIIKGSIEGGITAFLSNLLVFVINLFATTLKKIVSMIRAGFVSLVQALKIMMNPPEGMSKEEANFQAVKIMTAGLIGALSLGLSAAIEKFLQAIPGLQPIMMFPIPSFGGEPRTVSDIIAVTLSSLVGGVLTTITLYMMDKLKKDSEKAKLQIQMVYQSGVIVEYSKAQSWLSLYDAYESFVKDSREVVNEMCYAYTEIEKSKNEVNVSKLKYTDALNRLKKIKQQ